MAKKRRPALVVASKVKAYVNEIDRDVSTALRDVRRLGQRFPGNGDVPRTARLGLEDLARAFRTFKHAERAIDSLGQYLTDVQRG